jgi:hypothetical protein
MGDALRVPCENDVSRARMPRKKSHNPSAARRAERRAAADRCGSVDALGASAISAGGPAVGVMHDLGESKSEGGGMPRRAAWADVMDEAEAVGVSDGLLEAMVVETPILVGNEISQDVYKPRAGGYGVKRDVTKKKCARQRAFAVKDFEHK